MSKFSELDKIDEISRQSEAIARRSLNALAVTSSIVNALIQHPGPVGDHGIMVQSARAMLAQADEMATRLNSKLALESLPWARYRLMRMTTEAVSNRWIASARQNSEPTPDISDFLPVWHEMAKYDLPTFQFKEQSEDERVMMQISVLDAMQPVLQEIAVFDLFHDKVPAAMHARAQILDAANSAVSDLLPPNASKRASAQLLEALMRHAGSVYASNWRIFSQEVVERLRTLSVSEQEREVGAHPGGWPLDEVDKRFRSTFEKLADMVVFLAHPEDQKLRNRSDQDQENSSKRAYLNKSELSSDSAPTQKIPESVDSVDSVDSVFPLKNESNQPAAISLLSKPDKGFSIFDTIDGDEEMDEAPDWDDDLLEMPSQDNESFAFTANMTEPASKR